MTTRTMYARIGLSLSLGLLVIAGGLRQARAAEPRRLGVVTFRGPGEGATRNVVMKTGKTNKYQIVGGQQIAKAASKLHVTLDTNDSFKALAKELGVAAFITGEVTKKKATLTVRNGLDGSVSAEASWTGPNPRKLSVAVSKTLWRRLGSAIDRTKAPTGSKAAVVAQEEAAPETGADDAGGADEPERKAKDKGKPKAEEKAVAADGPADDDAASEKKSKSKKSKKEGGDDEAGSETTVVAGPESDDDEGGPAQEALMVGVGTRVVSRALGYTQDLNRNNSKYNLAAAPEVGFHVDLYPMALTGGGGFAANVGLTADVAYMLPVVSSPTPPPPTGNGVGKFATYSLDWSLGAKVRLPAGLYGTLAYGAHRYQLIPQGGASGIDVPMVDYRFVRVGAGLRMHVTPEVAVMAQGAYLQCMGTLGQISSANYFPRATCGAFEAGAAIGYRINSLLEIQAGADIRRYGLAFHVSVADAQAGRRVAGGAVDQYLMGWAALTVVLGGGSESGGGGGGEKAKSDEADGDQASDESKKAKKESDGDAEADDDSDGDDEKPKKKKKAADEDADL